MKSSRTGELHDPSQVVSIPAPPIIPVELFDAVQARLAAEARNAAELTLEKIDAFAALMRRKLDDGDPAARKAYLRSVVSRVEVSDAKIRIIGEKAALADVIAGRQTAAARVSGFVRNWRMVAGEVENYPIRKMREIQAIILKQGPYHQFCWQAAHLALDLTVLPGLSC